MALDAVGVQLGVLFMGERHGRALRAFERLRVFQDHRGILGADPADCHE
jgi:hypothetical protein